MRHTLLGYFVLLTLPLFGQQAESLLTYQITAEALGGKGIYAPLWFTSNNHGLINNNKNAVHLQAGFNYYKKINKNWNLNTGLDLTGGINQTSAFHLHQFYIDFGWKALNLSLGQKERTGFPLTKNERLAAVCW